MAFDWFDSLADAESYFTDERLVTTDWDALDNTKKTKVIIQAYNWIYYGNRFAVPTKAAATAAELIILKKAQGECCYFLAQHLDDMDRRKGIQAQGVIEAGVVMEKYNVDDLHSLPYPPFVIALLEDFDQEKAFDYKEIDRDPDKDANESVL